MSDSRRLACLLKDCANGFYQQMYFLGKDVVHPTGNQLSAYGFEKSPSRGLKGTSCYAYDAGDHRIELYGSCAGVYSASSQLVYLRKKGRFYHWLPEHRLVAGCWSQEDLDAGKPESLMTALRPLLQWWLDYERWIEKRHGQAYRERCYHEWSKIKSQSPWLPPAAAMAWVAEFLEKRGQTTRPKQFV
ncbi:hypothetical protein JIN77_10105 [Verrucomicrobiaceae bacterium R5-34]|nr:hypothetical protein [Verrucomicrobiaceae bacterium R5-34]